MANFKLKLFIPGLVEFRTSNDVKELCESYAEKAVKSLGEGYAMSSTNGKQRASAKVTAVWRQTVKKELETNSMLKAIGGK